CETTFLGRLLREGETSAGQGGLFGLLGRLFPRSRGGNAEDADSAGRALRTAVFDRLRDALDGCKRLVLSPDGELCRLPFAVLPLEGNRRLIDQYAISYIGSGRDLLRCAAPFAGAAEPPVVIADPDFGVTHSERQGFERLPGTRPEG